MRKRLVGLLFTAGLLVGVGAVPASATGCPTIGEEWSAWAADKENEYPVGVGEWTGPVASSGEAEGYPVAGGPGVISRVVSVYCD